MEKWKDLPCWMIIVIIIVKNHCIDKNHLNIQCKPHKTSMTFFKELEK